MTRNDAGQSVIDALTGLAVIALIAIAIAQLFSATSRANINSRSADRAVAVGHTETERARALGCGSEVGTEETLANRYTRCAAGFGGIGLGGYSHQTNANGINYTVQIATRWNTPTYAVAVSPSCTYVTKVTPNNATLLVRDVTVTWQQGTFGTPRVQRFTTLESAPPDAIEYGSEVRGGIVVRGVPVGRSVGIRMPTNTDPNQIIYRPSDPQGCVWFPYLAGGNWNLYTDDPSPTSWTGTVFAGSTSSTCTTYVTGAACPTTP